MRVHWKWSGACAAVLPAELSEREQYPRVRQYLGNESLTVRLCQALSAQSHILSMRFAKFSGVSSFTSPKSPRLTVFPDQVQH